MAKGIAPEVLGRFDKDTLKMEAYPPGFEEDDRLRCAFIRDLTLQQLSRSSAQTLGGPTQSVAVPRTLIRYWHDPCDVPDDVRACLASWDRLRDEGFTFRMFSDASAAAYVAGRYGAREREAFAR